MASSQKEIARLLGLSTNTVSLGLRNSPRISPETRRKIQDTANRLDYQANPYARGLALHRVRKAPERIPIAFLNFWSQPSVWRDKGALYELYNGCAERAEELGYYINEFQLRAKRITAAVLNRTLRGRGIRGIIVPPTPLPNTHLLIDWREFAAVAVGFAFRKPELHRVGPNFRLALQLAWHHLRHAQYQRIGLLLSKAFVQRMNGLPEETLLYLQRALPVERRLPILWTTWHTFQDVIGDWMEQHRPDVILSFWPEVYDWLISNEFSVPENIGYVSLDRTKVLDTHFPRKVTGISMAHTQIGARAVDSVIQLLERNEFGPPETPVISLVTPKWIAGETIRRRAAR